MTFPKRQIRIEHNGILFQSDTNYYKTLENNCQVITHTKFKIIIYLLKLDNQVNLKV